MHKKVYRSNTNKIFAGIFGGLGEYFDIDPAILRLIWVVVLVFTAIIPGILVYILAYFIIPPRPDSPSMSDLQQNQEHPSKEDHA